MDSSLFFCSTHSDCSVAASHQVFTCKGSVCLYSRFSTLFLFPTQASSLPVVVLQPPPGALVRISPSRIHCMSCWSVRTWREQHYVTEGLPPSGLHGTSKLAMWLQAVHRRCDQCRATPRFTGRKACSDLGQHRTSSLWPPCPPWSVCSHLQHPGLHMIRRRHDQP